jgi:hypothetical protein
MSKSLFPTSLEIPSPLTPQAVAEWTKLAVANFWNVRARQKRKQENEGKADAGSRGAVTGGAHLNGFIEILLRIARASGFDDSHIFTDKSLELPGFFRPTKKWDFLIIKNKTLVAAIELKGQVGPSFGNNFNNRTEEAIGTAKDIWVAYREKRLGDGPPPWLGYFFLLERCQRSLLPVAVSEPHFEVFPEFKSEELQGRRTKKAGQMGGNIRGGSSYSLRYSLLCEKLVLERLYTASSLILVEADRPGEYIEPKPSLGIYSFLAQLQGHLQAINAITG